MSSAVILSNGLFLEQFEEITIVGSREDSSKEDSDSRSNLTRIDSQSAEKDELLLPKGYDTNLVDWYGTKDPYNPQNYSFARKIWLTALIIILTIDV